MEVCVSFSVCRVVVVIACSNSRGNGALNVFIFYNPPGAPGSLTNSPCLSLCDPSPCLLQSESGVSVFLLTPLFLFFTTSSSFENSFKPSHVLVLAGAFYRRFTRRSPSSQTARASQDVTALD